MEGKSKQEQLIIKICCLVAAFVLWLYIYNVENPLKDRVVTVPVKIVNQDFQAGSKLAPIIDGDITIKITIRGNVSDLYSVKLEEIELEADLKSLALKKGENKIPVTVKKIPSGIKVVGAENLNVKINVDELVEKTVPVKATLQGKAQAGFYAITPELQNKEVLVKGPSQIVNQVKYASAICDVSNASKDVTIKASLQAESATGTKFSYVQLEPDTLEITVNVKKVKAVGINVKLTGNLDNSTLVKSVLPVDSTIEIAGNDDVLNNISSLDTEPVNIKSLTGQQVLETKLVMPEGVAVVNNVSVVKLNVTYNTAVVKTVSVPIMTKNLPADLNAAMSSSTVSMKLSGPEGLINSLKADNMECYVELQGLTAGSHELQVNVKLPEGVSKEDVNPSKITVTLSNKDTGGQ